MWNELITDGEIVTESCYIAGSDDNGFESKSSDLLKDETSSETNENMDKDNKKSEFTPILEEWTWGEV